MATIFFHLDFLKDGKPIAGFQRAMILVAVRKHGEWKVAAGQSTKETVAPGRAILGKRDAVGDRATPHDPGAMTSRGAL